MNVTRSFKTLVQNRIARDPEFAAVLLREAIDTMLTGDMETGKTILRDYHSLSTHIRPTRHRRA